MSVKIQLLNYSWSVGEDTFTVVAEDAPRVTACGASQVRWLVEHNICGTVFSMSSAQIRNNSAAQCSTCFKIEQVNIGDVYGRWTVIGGPKVENRIGKKTHKIEFWLCQCICCKHTQLWVRRTSLTTGHSNSCGCLNREVIAEQRFNDLSQTTFGRLHPLYTAGKSTSGGYLWMCYCDPLLGGCGTHKVISGALLKSGDAVSCGCYNKQRTKETHSGSKNNWWKGGITSVKNKIRSSCEYTSWRRSIFERDNYVDQYFGGKDSKVVAHHIKPFAQILEENNILTLEEALVCEELWDTNNGVTLAREFHEAYSKNKLAFHRVWGSKKCTAEDFRTWFAERPFKEGRCYYENWTN
jgi:hypothetical protein